MKAVLVIDTPTTCAGCPCYDYIHGVCAITYKDCELRKQTKPTWCPLRPLPKEEEKPIKGEDDYNDFCIGYTRGWNECLEDILGETE